MRTSEFVVKLRKELLRTGATRFGADDVAVLEGLFDRACVAVVLDDETPAAPSRSYGPKKGTAAAKARAMKAAATRAQRLASAPGQDSGKAAD